MHAHLRRRNARVGGVAGMLVVISLFTGTCRKDVVRGSDAGVETRGSGATSLHILVVDDETRRPIPAQLTFIDANGNVIAFGNLIDRPGWSQGRSAGEFGDGALAFAHGLAIWRGEATVPIGLPYTFLDPFQKDTFNTTLRQTAYRVVVSRGPEYDLFETNLDFSRMPADAQLLVSLKRTVDTQGYRAADLHVHSTPGSPDSGALPRNQLALAAASGLEVVVSTDHDHLTNLQHAVLGLWPTPGTPPLATLVGIEVSNIGSHFTAILRDNPPEADFLAAHAAVTLSNPAKYLEGFKRLPGRPFVMMAHGRLGYGGYMQTAPCGAWVAGDRSGPPPCAQNFDAMELLSGWAVCGSKVREILDDWYQLMVWGVVHPGIGASDSHYTSGIIIGTPRTYVRIDDSRLEALQPARLVDALRARRAVASSGPFLTLRIGEGGEGDLVPNPGGPIKVRVRVQAANWVDVREVALFVNGAVATKWTVERQARQAVAAVFDAVVGPFDSDAFITAEARGNEPLPRHLVGLYNYDKDWGMAKCPPEPGQPPGTIPFAVTNPLFIDADGDGLFRGAKAPLAVALPTVGQ